MDRIRQLNRWPAVGEFEEYFFESISVGGEAANTALALALWNNHSIIYGNPVGMDDQGNDLVAELVNRDVDCSLLIRNNDPTGACDVFITPDGERTMIGRGWPNFFAPAPTFEETEWACFDRNMPDWSMKMVIEAKKSKVKILLMDFSIDQVNEVHPEIWQSSTDCFGTKNLGNDNLDVLKSLDLPSSTLAVLTDGVKGQGVRFQNDSVWLPAYSYQVLLTLQVAEIFFGLDYFMDCPEIGPWLKRFASQTRLVV